VFISLFFLFHSIFSLILLILCILISVIIIFIIVIVRVFYFFNCITICLIICNIYDTMPYDIIFKMIIFLCGIVLSGVFIYIRCFIIEEWIGIVLMLRFIRILDRFVKLILGVRIGFELIIF
jgi:hypothetical protein